MQKYGIASALVEHRRARDRRTRASDYDHGYCSLMKVRIGPAGFHFFDRRSGLNLLSERTNVPTCDWSAAPRSVSVALTNACDLACPYCYAPKAPAALEARFLVEWIEELDANGCLGVGFGGGEPTLHKDLASVCRHVTRHTTMAATITTHGHFLGAPLARSLEGNVHLIRLSMDGVGPTYESLRGRPFGAFVRHARIASSIARVGLNFVVNTTTLPDLDEAVDVAMQIGASQFLLLPEMSVDCRTGLDHGTVAELKDWVMAYKGPIPLAVSTTTEVELPICDPLPAEGGLRAFAHIDARGRIKRSSFERDGIPIGPGGVLRALEHLARSDKGAHV